MSNVVLQGELSPTSVLRSHSETVPKTTKRKKKSVADKDFTIPKFSEYELLATNNYKVLQLKEMCRHYKQKVSGNKTQLVSRIYNYLRLSDSIVVIQRVFRESLLRRYNAARGPARINRKLCVNETDFFTMEQLVDIPLSQFYSYKDPEDQIYGFSIMSLYNLLSKGDSSTTNPYNRQPFPASLRTDINFILKVSACFGDEVEIEIEQEEALTPEKQLELRSLTLFQNIDALGNYSDCSWFNGLNRTFLIRFLRELADIWTYRAQLNDHVKREICPPVGDPFRAINLHALPNLALNSLKRLCLGVMEHMVNRGTNESSRALGANYVLCALTLVNVNAAQALPWLYQSVAQQD